MPIGIKDIFDTGDMPTEFGSPFWAGRTPRDDAAAVARLRAAGAVIMGKTVTTEYAYFHPGKTRNPHDPGAHAGRLVERLGRGGRRRTWCRARSASQTNGSVIRPAAFCGVVGFKPTHGLIPRTGALMLSRTLDHVGVFARSVEDAALLAEVLAGFDAEDPDTRPLARPPLAADGGERAAAAAALRLRALAGLEAGRAGDERGVRRAGRGARRAVTEVELGSSFEQRASTCTAPSWKSRWRTTSIATTRRAATSSATHLRAADRARPRPCRRSTIMRAVAAIAPLNAALDEVFNEYDAILTPAAPGEAPRGLRAPAIRRSARPGPISARRPSPCR